MTMRVCAEPGCPSLQSESRCSSHRSARERTRGTKAERGYDARYAALRKQYARRMAGGESFVCWRCRDELGTVHNVDPSHWHLGHDDDDRSIIRGPECPTGNLAAAGRQHPGGRA